VLIIAYYFPPSGGPGVQRVLKMVKYLREFGWQPLVLTVSNGQFPARDESLLDEIPEDVKVFRTKIFEPYDVYRFLTGKRKGEAIDVNTIKKEGQKSSFKDKIAEFIRATFFIPDARIGWFFSAKNEVCKIIEEEGIDALYSSSPPFTCSVIARHAKRKTRVKWVAGLRDPWTDFIISPKRWWLPKFIDKKMEKSVFKESDWVECAWLGIISDAMEKYPELNEGKFKHVPNGFDSEDFPKIQKKENNVFTITYTGSLYGRRNPSSLFSAVEELIKENKVDVQKIKFLFVGRFGQEVEEMFGGVSFADRIETVGYVPHKESIKYLMKSDLLLLIVDESKESKEIVPGKVYEYIGVEKPVFAIAPQESAISDLIRETNAGKIAHQDERENLKRIYLNYYDSWKNGKINYKPNYEKIKKYERRNSAKLLADLLTN
jgi:hypothetical protein